MTNLAKRAVACAGWHLLPGLRLDDGSIVLAARDGLAVLAVPEGTGEPWVTDWVEVDGLPDLTDACTLGGLLALVREVWGNQRMFVADLSGGSDDERWAVRLPGALYPDPYSYPTEAEALVAALEAAP